MQTQSIKVFKNELGSYKGYVEQAKKLEEIIEELYRRLSGVKAIDTTKLPTHSLPNKDAEYELRENIEKYKKKLSLVKDMIVCNSSNFCCIQAKFSIASGRKNTVITNMRAQHTILFRNHTQIRNNNSNINIVSSYT